MNRIDAVPLRAANDTIEEVELHSLITCPECGYSEREEMSTDALSVFYYCKGLWGATEAP
ncbi:MAG: hypothetical protein DHS20C08_00090 [Rhodomicrobium sp.]|nr:MAG: hypothetical protein DHS20C08_00090 [Rhodomicrobium sp.]